MRRVLFICVHNSARSQMAEEYVRLFGGEDFAVESAGLAPTAVNPLVVEVMREEGVDLAGKQTRKAFDLYKAGKVYDYVVTVCSESVEGQCPVFPGVTHRLHLPFPDPAAVQGTHEEKLAQVRAIREDIKRKMAEFVSWVRCGGAKKLGDSWEMGKN
jgi:arsenate reductase